MKSLNDLEKEARLMKLCTRAIELAIAVLIAAVVFNTCATASAAQWFPLGKEGASTYWVKKKKCERKEKQRCFNLRGHHPSDFVLSDGKWLISRSRKAKRLEARKKRAAAIKRRAQRKRQRVTELGDCVDAGALKGAQLKTCIGLIAEELLDGS